MRIVCVLSAAVLTFVVAGETVAVAGEAVADRLNSPKPQVRRAAVLEVARSGAEARSLLSKMLNDGDPVVRRTAARALAKLGKAAMPDLVAALDNDDVVVRRTAVWALGATGPEAVRHLAKALGDEDPLVRQRAVEALSAVRPCTPEVVSLLEKGSKDACEPVSRAARIAMRDIFTVVKSVRLPADGWAFKLDPEDKGRKEEWFRPDLDESGWSKISIEKAWQDAGVDYVGPAWYRRVITLPQKPNGDRVVLYFGGVDECAWVWVNGKYAGEHDIGPRGWNISFELDVADLVKWGQPNQITVRAKNTAAKGGIWRPVELRVLKLAGS